MKTITAPQNYDYKNSDIKVFLAGGITNCANWQQEVIDLLNNDESQLENLVILNPRRENFPINDPCAAFEQIEWEYKMLEQCDIFSMYFSAGESDQPICMYELGRNILRMQMRFPSDWEKRIIISVEDGYKRKSDVFMQVGFATNDIIIASSISDHDISVKCHANDIKNTYRNLVHKWMEYEMLFRGYEICVGDKLETYDNTYKSIVELEKQLNAHGIETRIGCNPESGVWSVAILGGVPNNKYDCNREEITEITKEGNI